MKAISRASGVSVCSSWCGGSEISARIAWQSDEGGWEVPESSLSSSVAWLHDIHQYHFAKLAFWSATLSRSSSESVDRRSDHFGSRRDCFVASPPCNMSTQVMVVSGVLVSAAGGSEAAPMVV